MKSPTVLVAGAAGFLGSHLSRALLLQGCTVLAIDDLSTGNRENLRDLMSLPAFTFIEHDVREPFTTHQDLQLIFNLACPASPRWYQRDPVRTWETSVLGARNLLTLARSRDARILQASTSEVYGTPLVSPQSEDYWGNVNPVGPRSCYDEGKRSAETLFADFRCQYDVDARIARIFNTYGPSMALDDGRVVSQFIVQALQGAAITIFGTGLQTRSFCFVSDLIEGLVKLAFLEDFDGVPVNLGSTDERTIRETAEMIIMATGSKSALHWEPLPQDDPPQRRPDIRRAQELIEWDPKVGFAEGLEATIAHFRARIDGSSSQKRSGCPAPSAESKSSWEPQS